MYRLHEVRHLVLLDRSTPQFQTPNWSDPVDADNCLCHLIISRWRWKFQIRNAVLIFHCVRRWRRNECESIPRTFFFCTDASPHHRINSTFWYPEMRTEPFQHCIPWLYRTPTTDIFCHTLNGSKLISKTKMTKKSGGTRRNTNRQAAPCSKTNSQ